MEIKNSYKTMKRVKYLEEIQDIRLRTPNYCGPSQIQAAGIFIALENDKWLQQSLYTWPDKVYLWGICSRQQCFQNTLIFPSRSSLPMSVRGIWSEAMFWHPSVGRSGPVSATAVSVQSVYWGCFTVTFHPGYLIRALRWSKRSQSSCHFNESISPEQTSYKNRILF